MRLSRTEELRLVYHSTPRPTIGESPFALAVMDVAGLAEEVWLACPYVDVNLIPMLLGDD